MNKFNRLVVVHSPKSSRAAEYDKEIAPGLRRIADSHGAELIEISLNYTPYFESVQMVRDSLLDGDVVLGAGGDGINQVTLQGAFESHKDIVAGFLPLGNANDFATALNGRVKNPEKILASQIIDFCPLDLSINGRKKFHIAVYATFGITTIAVDWLNSEEIRGARKRFAGLPPMAALKPRYLGQMSRDINDMTFPYFRRDSTIYHDDSVGFFLAPAAKGMLKLPGVSNLITRDDFFFHSDSVRDKSLGKGWIGKGLRAGKWAAFGLPGTVSDYEKLEFLHPSDMTIHVGGDTVHLTKVHIISAERSKRALKIFAPRCKSLQP